jgi:hypothetical protein
MRKTASRDLAKAMLRSIFVLLFAFALYLPMSAQRNMLLYNMSNTPQAYQLNVGRMPDRSFHLGLPLISNFNLGIGLTGFQLKNLRNIIDVPTDPNKPEEFFERDFSQTLSLLSPKNTINFDFNTNVLDLGFRVRKFYFNITSTENIHGQATFANTLFETALQAQKMTVDSFYAGPRRFPISNSVDDLGLSLNHFRTYGLGMTVDVVPQKLSVGARVKALSGIGRVITENKGLEIVGDLSQGILGIEGELSMTLAGIQSAFDGGSVGNYLLGSGNNGLGFDAGVQFRPTKNIELLASFVNFGKITWGSGVQNYSYRTKYLAFSLEDKNAADKAVSGLIEFATKPEKNESAGELVTSLPMNAYFGGNFLLGKKFSAGVLVNTLTVNGLTSAAYSAQATFRAGRGLQTSLNVSKAAGEKIKMGYGLVSQAGPVQVFAVTDNVLGLFGNAGTIRFQIHSGINFTFGRGPGQSKKDLSEEEKAKQEKMLAEQALADVQKVQKDSVLAAEKPAKSKPTNSKTEPKASDSDTRNKTSSKTNRPADEMPDPKARKLSNPNTPEAIAATLRPNVNLHGSAFVKESKEQLRGTVIEVFEMKEGKDRMAFIRSNPSESINLVLDRNKNYKIVVRKHGYRPAEAMILSQNMQGIAEVTQDFYLPTGVADEPVANTKPLVEELPSADPEKAKTATPEPFSDQPSPTPLAPAPQPSNTGSPTSNKVTTEPAKPNPVPNATNLKSQGVFTIVAACNLLSEANESAATLLKINPGFRVELLDKSNPEWWMIRFRGETGYVKAKHLVKEN